MSAIIISTEQGDLPVIGGMTLVKRFSEIADISSVLGGTTYSFQVPYTRETERILGIALNLLTPVRTRLVPCSVLIGASFVFKGLLYVEKYDRGAATCRIIEANSEWIAQLKDVKVADIDLGILRYSPANVGATQSARDGAFWGVVNGGVNDNTLFFNQKTIADLRPCVFVKDVIAAAFNSIGLLVQGDLVENPDYQSLVLVMSNGIISQANALNRELYNGAFTGSIPDSPLFLGDREFENSAITAASPFFSLSLGKAEFRPDVPSVYNVRVNYTLDWSGSTGVEDGTPIFVEDVYIVFFINGTKFTEIDISTTGPSPEVGSTTALISLMPTDALTVGVNTTDVLNSIEAEVSIELVALGEFDIRVSDFSPNLKVTELINYTLNLFAGFANKNAATGGVDLLTFDAVNNSKAQDLSDKIAKGTEEFREEDFTLAFINEINYSETEENELLGSGTFIVDKSFLANRGEFLSFPTAGSYYRLSQSISTTLPGFEYFRESSVIPFDVSEPQATTEAGKIEIGDKFVIYPFATLATPKLNNVNSLEFFESVAIESVAIFVSSERSVFGYSYLYNCIINFLFNEDGFTRYTEISKPMRGTGGGGAGFQLLEEGRQLSKIEPEDIEPRILVAGEQVPDIDVTVFIPTGTPTTGVLNRIEIQRVPIRPKHLYFSRPLQTWSAPIYQTVYSPSFNSEGTRDIGTLTYWQSYLKLLRDGRSLEVDIYLTYFDYLKLDITKPVYIRTYGANFIVKELKYKVGEFVHRITLVKI